MLRRDRGLVIVLSDIESPSDTRRLHPKAKGNAYQRRLMIQRIARGLPAARVAGMAGWSESRGPALALASQSG
jgi:hypothetical protein